MSNIIDAGTGTTVTINNKTYTMSPMRLHEYKMIAERLKEKQRDEIKTVLETYPETPERMEIVKQLLHDITDGDVDEYMTTVEGSLYMMWSCLNIKHPEFTYEEFEKISADDLGKLQVAAQDVKEKPIKNAGREKGKVRAKN